MEVHRLALFIGLLKNSAFLCKFHGAYREIPAILSRSKWICLANLLDTILKLHYVL